MNITFLIGNGFDLNCGMKTSYRDVYKGYCKEKSDEPIIQNFKNQINGNLDTWGDFEVAMSKEMNSFQTEEDFLICLRDYKKYMNLYLVTEEKRINDLIRNGGEFTKDLVAQEWKEALSSFYDGITHNLTRQINQRIYKESCSFSFITFNYTSTVESIREIKSKNVFSDEIIHVHGKLNDDAILGMDNEQQISNCSFQLTNRTRRAFLKPFLNREYDDMRMVKALDVIRGADIVCVFGLSLGISDLMWRNALLETLSSDSPPEVFYFKHELSSLVNLTIDERMDIEENEKEKLLTLWNVPIKNKPQCTAHLHMPCGKKIFCFQEAILEGSRQQHELLLKKKEITNQL